MLADYEPGTLTALYIVCLGGLCVLVSVILAVGLRLLGHRERAGRFIKAAFVFVWIFVIVVLFETLFTKKLGLP